MRVDRFEVAHIERDAGTQLLEERAATVGVQHQPAVEGIEVGPGSGTDEEVPGHAHAVERDVETPADLDEHHAQRDRDAHAASQHLVEVRVAWIAVVGPVPGEGAADRGVTEQGSRDRLGVVRVRRREGFGEPIDGPELGVDVDGMVVCCDQQRREIEWHVARGKSDQRREALRRIGRRRHGR